jgi:hypothetical protein
MGAAQIEAAGILLVLTDASSISRNDCGLPNRFSSVKTADASEGVKCRRREQQNAAAARDATEPQR